MRELVEVVAAVGVVQGREGMVVDEGRDVVGVGANMMEGHVAVVQVEPNLHNTGRYLVGSMLVDAGEVQLEPSLSWVYNFVVKGIEHRGSEAEVVERQHLLHSDLAADLEGCYYGFP